MEEVSFKESAGQWKGRPQREVALELGDKATVLVEVSCVLLRILRVINRKLARTKCTNGTLDSPFHSQSTLPVPRGGQCPLVTGEGPVLFLQSGFGEV